MFRLPPAGARFRCQRLDAHELHELAANKGLMFRCKTGIFVFFLRTASLNRIRRQ